MILIATKKPRRQIFIQIPFKIFTTLLDYFEKFQVGNYTFPDFFDKCPICQKKDCAVKIGFYYRWVADIDYTSLKIILFYIPIPRYKCKAPPKGKHHTFSLLPDNLIPYNRYSIDLLIYILKIHILKNKNTKETLNEVDLISPDSCLISDKILKLFLSLLEQARIKLILFFQQFPDKNKAPPDLNSFLIQETLQYLVNYPQFESNTHCGAYYLCSHYYKTNGSYQKNARFLFGTASQFCKKLF